MAELSASGQIINTARRLLELYANGEVVADKIRDGDSRAKRMTTMDIQNTTRCAIASRIWRAEGRQVLVMHPEVVAEVAVATSAKISGRVLQTLPFMSPMVVYAVPPEFDTWVNYKAKGRAEGLLGELPYTEAKMQLLGFVTYSHAPLKDNTNTWDSIVEQFKAALNGTRFDKPQKPMYEVFESTIFNTHDARGFDFGVAAIFAVLDDVGRQVDFEISLLSIPLGGDFTFAEMVDRLLERFAFTAMKDSREGRKWMRAVMATIVGTLFYLCSTTLENEVEKMPRKQAQKIQPAARKPPAVFKVGWKMGAALSALHRESLKNDADGSLSGREQSPQHRRGHFKMQPYGPKNSLRKLIYVSPYWTQLEKLHLYDVKTVRQVPRVGPPGSARDAMRSTLGVSSVMQEVDS